MADPKKDSGFALPAPQAAPDAPAAPDAEQHQLEVVSAAQTVVEGPQPRDYAIGGAVLVVLLIAFFFVRGAYANSLARKRVAPGSANAAGWCLFIFLASLACGSVLGVISPVKFVTPLFMAPILIIGLVALVLMVVSGRRS